MTLVPTMRLDDFVFMIENTFATLFVIGGKRVHDSLTFSIFNSASSVVNALVDFEFVSIHLTTGANPALRKRFSTA